MNNTYVNWIKWWKRSGQDPDDSVDASSARVGCCWSSTGVRNDIIAEGWRHTLGIGPAPPGKVVGRPISTHFALWCWMFPVRWGSTRFEGVLSLWSLVPSSRSPGLECTEKTRSDAHGLWRLIWSLFLVVFLFSFSLCSLSHFLGPFLFFCLGYYYYYYYYFGSCCCCCWFYYFWKFLASLTDRLLHLWTSSLCLDGARQSARSLEQSFEFVFAVVIGFV